MLVPSVEAEERGTDDQVRRRPWTNIEGRRGGSSLTVVKSLPQN